MIELKDLKKSFDEKPVLKGVSVVMDDGKCNLIIGSSGSGKTVLMKCMVGLFKPTSGNVLYDGADFVNLSDKEQKTIREKIGMLFQGGALFDSQTVEQNVMFPMDMFTNEKYSKKRERVKQVLDRVQLKEEAYKKFPSEISGGMQKRVALARAIVLNPKYLFCDEPNSGLDPQTSLVIDKLIHEITKEYDMTTIVNTHDMNSVMEIGDHIIYMHQGEKEWEGNNKEIIFSKNEKLNEFIFASEFLRDAKNMRTIQETGEIPKEVEAGIKDAIEEKLNVDLDGDGHIGDPGKADEPSEKKAPPKK
ncbi:ABC transporter ATP-binding protein [Niabella ginsenosidivorans]|uniref:ABC transporter ATP-binding protein n=1 Tax=Niabella ginsenosidivorans TaxID=1176587 RepID=A0A1A9HY97_9BACT|nr:ATP-binding cassette domain-containing protein [Niabella ginsenosidivorans]ANH79799.1 ABC transporter ATP-binding protein [Niabella ginsenosidivorans]